MSRFNVAYGCFEKAMHKANRMFGNIGDGFSVNQTTCQDRILAHQRSRFTHYYFYIRDEVLGPIIVRVASFFPFHATYWLNGHSFMEQELNRKQIVLQKRSRRGPLIARWSTRILWTLLIVGITSI